MKKLFTLIAIAGLAISTIGCAKEPAACAGFPARRRGPRCRRPSRYRSAG